jgi:parallel beta-helix repeat protein
LINNTVHDTQGKYGIFAANGSILVNNVAYQNKGWGIYASYSNMLRGDMAYSNNQSQTADQGGIRIGRDSQAINNTADSNYHTRIYLDGTTPQSRHRFSPRRRHFPVFLFLKCRQCGDREYGDRMCHRICRYLAPTESL